jgi:hypothetical protein
MDAQGNFTIPGVSNIIQIFETRGFPSHITNKVELP